MLNNKCSVCGGKLIISIDSGYAECENCGSIFEVDSEELNKLRAVYQTAQRKIRHNSTAGYKEAINLLQTILFVSEAQNRIEFCEARLAEIKESEAKRAEAKEQSEKNDKKTGIMIIILLLLVIALAAAGAIYIAIHLYRGDLSPKAVTAIVSVLIVFTVLTIIGKIKS